MKPYDIIEETFKRQGRTGTRWTMVDSDGCYCALGALARHRHRSMSGDWNRIMLKGEPDWGQLAQAHDAGIFEARKRGMGGVERSAALYGTEAYKFVMGRIKEAFGA